MRTQGEGGHLQTQEKGLRRDQTCGHLDVRLVASRMVREKFLLFKPLVGGIFYGSSSKLTHYRDRWWSSLLLWASDSHDLGRQEKVFF